MLVGEHVTLRRIEKADLWRLWQWHEERELYLFDSLDVSVSLDVLNDRFTDLFNLKGDFLIEDSNGRGKGVISYSNVFWRNRYCEVICEIYEDDDDQIALLDSLATMLNFLFHECNLTRVQTSVWETSAEKRSAIESIGFVPEGSLREHTYRDGVYEDTMVYAVLADEFADTQLRG